MTARGVQTSEASGEAPPPLRSEWVSALGDVVKVGTS